MSMLLRKELESLELTYPNETSAALNTTETNTTFGSSKRNLPSPSEEVILRYDEKKEKLFMRPGTIDKEPDSMDTIISNPSSFPITVLPPVSAGGAGVLIRNSTQTSFGRLSRISTNSKSRNYRPGSYRKIRRRAVLKNGDCNVLQKKISRRRIRFLQDIFTTLVDSQWRWTLIVFALSFVLSWLFFAMIWWLIAVTHGDLEEMHLPPEQAKNEWVPCVFNIYSFASCFLFSIETQHTIGYGVRTTTEECPEAIFVMCFQSIYGVFVQAFMVGIVFAKMTRPKQRTQTLLFSKYAVVCQRDGYLTLMFRVGDIRKSHIIGANIRAQLIRTYATKEGELNPQYVTELEIGTDGCASDLFFIWPMVVVHRIDESSPFYNMSAADMLQEKFEIVVILEGTIESTGQTTQARSSYLNMEILWGHRFLSVVSYNNERQGYDIDYSKFNETIPVDTPLCSGRELAEFYKMQEEIQTPTEQILPADDQSITASTSIKN
ncbi:G protein-activated inward rectifier potassium channel 3-like isoform X2 [Sitodiplosis mosellana]|uniref:G protein-activated inward rectifier potassium channel 3-like isoform X2 n=1 Tax=Sitodiplosis mosellana TaxID=263140 RepID=UPI0024437A0E|nr:G protein-activated inward rectifier potassium channel 3-like isoform X2 [Sitodiplosis mosellana]